MRVSLKWLSDFIDLPTTDVGELSRVFDYLGHTVEETVTHEVEWTGVVIGRVARIEPHPNADNIRVTHVDIGSGELQQIICGAWNFEEGAVVPVAVPGAVLPGNFEIGRRAIRGVESNGMICSERELGLGDAHRGILVLEGTAPIGQPFESVLELPDVVFDLEVTNNRPDVMGIVGVARELAAWFDIDFRKPDIGLATVPGSPATKVTISAPDGCNRFVAREIRGVTVGPSPLWVRERLRKSGVRAISNVVDVTNYVMLELGHPLHAFDADRIAGDRLDVHWAEPGEVLVTLDGSERPLTSDDLVIADADGPTSLAAVMGGARSEVGEDTRRVLMESASWNPTTVMYTSRRHDLRSEASARFERGVDPNLAPDANARACRMLVDISGGEVLDGVIDEVANPVAPWTVALSARDVQRILGDDFDLERSAGLLRRLHLGVDEAEDGLVVTIPTYRPDLTRPADLVEEIARLSDYDTFEATVPTGPAGRLTAEQQRTRELHDTLRGLGLHQVINLPFVSPEELRAFGDGEAVVTVTNPLREDQAKLRQSLLPGLLRVARDNRNRGAEGVALFEIGKVFWARPSPDDERVPDQPDRTGAVVLGPFGPASIGAQPDIADGRTAFAVVDAVSTAMGVALTRQPATIQGLHPHRAAEILVGDTVIGFAGELHPVVAELFELNERVAVVELALAPLAAAHAPQQLRPVSTFPHVDFDLSFELAGDAAAAEVVAATSAVTDVLERAQVFDEYRDETGVRSVAISYRLRAEDRTLTGDDIAEQRQNMIAAAAAMGAVLRGGNQ